MIATSQSDESVFRGGVHLWVDTGFSGVLNTSQFPRTLCKSSRNPAWRSMWQVLRDVAVGPSPAQPGSRFSKASGAGRWGEKELSRFEALEEHRLYEGFPKLGVPFLGVPIRRTIVY